MLKFTENPRSSGLSASTNPRIALSAHGLVEATQAQAEGGTATGRYMSPLRTAQAIEAILYSGAALTKVDDTNVTLTLSANAPTSLLRATSITVGWSGTLAVSRGGTGISSFGTGVATWLGTPSSANLASAITDETGSGALVFATTPTLITPILGTPTSGTLTNCDGLPIATGVSGLGTGIATFLATPSSANLATALTDETGSAGGFVRATSPTITTPNIVGTSTNDSAAAGSVGEHVSSSIASGSAVALTTATPANVTSISLTAGDWDVRIAARFTGNAATTLTTITASLSATSATLDTTEGRIGSEFYNGQTPFASTNVDMQIVPFRISLSGTTTIYFVVQATFGVSTCSAFGIISARRVR